MTRRLHMVLRGAVQGIGFRPFVYRLATEMALAGFVNNSPQGVFIEVEGEPGALERFLFRLQREKPARSFIQSLEYTFLDPVPYSGFEVRPSSIGGDRNALILPDIATCPDCLREILDPSDRRYRYPFTNCTNCGPRYSIILALPYDRANTTMGGFEMCPTCRQEYENPGDRRFHAQPIACPVCGPQLELWEPSGSVAATRDEALSKAAERIRAGEIVAIKGLGGFQLIVDARNPEAVARLRRRKHREEKPFALLYPSLEAVRAACEVEPLEERLLLSPECPITLLRRKEGPPGDCRPACDLVAPHNPYLGVMLPCTPLHHLLVLDLGFPVVATSGNLSEEPICTDENQALVRLRGIADAFLVHNRPIARHVDDSIARVMLGRELILRRARGYAPLPVALEENVQGILAVGGHLKNTVALAVGKNAFVSQHIGDLENRESLDAFEKTITGFKVLFGVQPSHVAADLHPDYASTRYAQNLRLEMTEVQHHYAHILACMAENRIDGPALGVSWDGTGLGTDQTIWGGEFLAIDEDSFRRIGSFRPFMLPGGNQAVREPRRTAAGVLYEIMGDSLFEDGVSNPAAAFDQASQNVIRQMLQKKVNCPVTSSAGRLFDAVASMIGLRQKVRFEGQAAMELEFSLLAGKDDPIYPFALNGKEWSIADSGSGAVDFVFDWEVTIRAILKDVHEGIAQGTISWKFHNTLVEVIVSAASRAGLEKVVLSGGCFQNRYLTEQAVKRLERSGFKVYWHQRIPPNDGGIALGQVIAAFRALRVAGQR